VDDLKLKLKLILENSDWSVEDRKWLLEYLNKNNTSELQQLMQQLFANETELKDDDQNERAKQLIKIIHSKIVFVSKPAQLMRLGIWTKVAAAAIVLLCISISVLIFKQPIPVNEINQVVEISKTINKPLYKNDIKPGGNKAFLTLADGSKIILDDAAQGTLTKQGNTTIIKLDDGRLAYNPQSISKLSPKAVQYNTLTTPRGGQYCVTLPDGTVVWLNASTSLKFPIAFNGNERKVEVHGEAYFEVAKNETMPFIVSAGNSVVKVLGTHFNVSAYADDKIIKTTLLEGSVEVSLNAPTPETTNNVITLAPGQQSQLDLNNGLTVVTADLNEVVAWKNGYFIFNNENIESIMLKVSRWYDIKVDYQVDVSNKKFTANISRQQNVSEVLNMLEQTEAIHFKIDGKSITVLP